MDKLAEQIARTSGSTAAHGIALFALFNVVLKKLPPAEKADVQRILRSFAKGLDKAFSHDDPAENLRTLTMGTELMRLASELDEPSAAP